MKSMHLDAVKYFYDRTLSQNPSFIFVGNFDQLFTGVILDMAETGQSSISANGAVKKKVSYMLVESFQNLIKHAESDMSETISSGNSGMFSFKNYPHGFVINSINYVRNKDVPSLESQVMDINSMSQPALKDHYLNRLNAGKLSDKGGAGLGLIELARKSGQKILYHIAPISSEYSFFHQQVTLLCNDQGQCGCVNSEIDDSQEVYDTMKQQGLNMVFKGDVSNKSLLPILEFLQMNVDKSCQATKHITRTAHVLIEISQNITKQSLSSEYGNTGILMLGKKSCGRSLVLSGNIVGLADKIILEEKLQYLSNLNRAELVDLHLKTMRASLYFENKTRTGLGLIEIARASTESIQYRFYPIEDDRYLFAMVVTI